MQKDRPNVFVTYQDAPTYTRMTCVEAVVSASVLLVMAFAAGWIAWPW